MLYIYTTVIQNTCNENQSNGIQMQNTKIAKRKHFLLKSIGKVELIIFYAIKTITCGVDNKSID